MKTVFAFLYVLLSLLFLIYTGLPLVDFPSDIAAALQSKEPADIETSLRRAYFTNALRAEVVEHYRTTMSQGNFGLIMPTMRFNYPPEEAQSVIRDQTRSSYLEEIVIPFRQSLYINGFEPKEQKDAIIVESRPWKAKVTVKLVQSESWARLVSAFGTIIILPVLFFAWKNTLNASWLMLKEKKWTFR